MDPFSQAALGAVVAQASAQHKLGFRVVVAGAFAGAMPDIDVFFAEDYFHNLQIHRGICLLYTSPSPRDQRGSRMPSSA